MKLKFPDSLSITRFMEDSFGSQHPIIQAAKKKKLVIFVGAGMSVHLGIPGWRDFALKFLELVHENRLMTHLNFKAKESLAKEETRKILSICKFVADINITKADLMKAYKEWFHVNLRRVLDKELYEKLYSVNAIYITTNYDNALDLLAEQAIDNLIPKVSVEAVDPKVTLSTKGNVYYRLEDFQKDILKQGNVIHIHGSINDCDNLIISYEDYIKRYNRRGLLLKAEHDCEEYNNFLDRIFNDEDNVILFIGYGLGEIEILQYLFNRLDGKGGVVHNNNRFLVHGCFADDYLSVSYLNHYYMNNYDLSIMPLDITDNGYDVSIDKFLDILLRLVEGGIKDTETNEDIIHTLAEIGRM